jgi:hypothetical protein
MGMVACSLQTVSFHLVTAQGTWLTRSAGCAQSAMPTFGQICIPVRVVSLAGNNGLQLQDNTRHHMHEALPSFASTLPKQRKQLRTPQHGSWRDARSVQPDLRSSTRDPSHGSVRQMPPLSPSLAGVEQQALLKRGMQDDSRQSVVSPKTGRYNGAHLERHLPSRDGGLRGAPLGALSKVIRRHADGSKHI